MIKTPIYPLSIAPMMDRTDRHYRYFIRLITKKTLLYTEMVPADAIYYGEMEKLIGYESSDHPVVLQVGGSDEKLLVNAAKIAEDWGYDEININIGCPSERVQSGSFGACLMKEPKLVKSLVQSMNQSCNIPVTVKNRIGVDEFDSYEFMRDFVEQVAEAGCERFIIHARIAILKGLSPKENRKIPPLKYDYIYRLKQEFPKLIIEINGGITSLKEAEEHLKHVDSVMIGRAAFDNPYLFSTADSKFFGSKDTMLSRKEVTQEYVKYAAKRFELGDPLSILMQPIFNIFSGEKGARHWRRFLSEHGHQKGATADVFLKALDLLP